MSITQNRRDSERLRIAMRQRRGHGMWRRRRRETMERLPRLLVLVVCLRILAQARALAWEVREVRQLRLERVRKTLMTIMRWHALCRLPLDDLQSNLQRSL
jgi:hypothetical protein